MGRLGMDDETPIEHGDHFQIHRRRRSEGQLKTYHRHVVQYDDVMNRHREVIYADRGHIVAGDGCVRQIDELVTEAFEAIVDRNVGQRAVASTTKR